MAAPLIDLTKDAAHVSQVVRVFLRPESRGLEREIALNSESPRLEMGRSSKAPGRNMLPARDNGRVESPIASREHARIHADFADKNLYLRDMSSTHGTFLNGHRLRGQGPARLAAGDRITLGQTIHTGPRTFPPKSFRLGYHWEDRLPREPGIPTPEESPAQPQAARTFSVPNDSDSDDMQSDVSVVLQTQKEFQQSRDQDFPSSKASALVALDDIAPMKRRPAPAASDVLRFSPSKPGQSPPQEPAASSDRGTATGSSPQPHPVGPYGDPKSMLASSAKEADGSPDYVPAVPEYPPRFQTRRLESDPAQRSASPKLSTTVRLVAESMAKIRAPDELIKSDVADPGSPQCDSDASFSDHDFQDYNDEDEEDQDDEDGADELSDLMSGSGDEADSAASGARSPLPEPRHIRYDSDSGDDGASSIEDEHGRASASESDGEAEETGMPRDSGDEEHAGSTLCAPKLPPPSLKMSMYAPPVSNLRDPRILHNIEMFDSRIRFDSSSTASGTKPTASDAPPPAYLRSMQPNQEHPDHIQAASALKLPAAPAKLETPGQRVNMCTFGASQLPNLQGSGSSTTLPQVGAISTAPYESIGEAEASRYNSSLAAQQYWASPGPRRHPTYSSDLAAQDAKAVRDASIDMMGFPYMQGPFANDVYQQWMPPPPPHGYNATLPAPQAGGYSRYPQAMPYIGGDQLVDVQIEPMWPNRTGATPDLHSHKPAAPSPYQVAEPKSSPLKISHLVNSPPADRPACPESQWQAPDAALSGLADVVTFSAVSCEPLSRPHSPSARGRKRKSDAISSNFVEGDSDLEAEYEPWPAAATDDEDNEEEEAAEDYEPSPAAATGDEDDEEEVAKDSVPDAQPRDIDSAPLFDPLSSLDEPAAEVAPAPQPTEPEPAEPSAKRAKANDGAAVPVPAAPASSSSRRSYARTFIKGAVAGAVTALGVAAALLATVPLDVQEEAMREL